MAVDAKQLATFGQFMARHFVAMICEYESFNPDGTIFHRGAVHFSGFILEVHDCWLWVTAGHCLKEELDARITKHEIRILTTAFMDYFGDKVTHRAGIPYEYEVGCGHYVDNSTIGIDIGFIQLDDNKRRLMEANGIVAIGRKDWLSEADVSFDMYKMLGVPKCEKFESENRDGSTHIEMRTVMFTIHPIDAEEIAAKEKVWFVGRIDERVEISTVVGMSGGPIFGFSKTQVNGKDRWNYHMIAVQSWWKEGKRIVFGSYLARFAEHLHQRILTLKTEIEGSG